MTQDKSVRVIFKIDNYYRVSTITCETNISKIIGFAVVNKGESTISKFDSLGEVREFIEKEKDGEFYFRQEEF